MKKRYLIIIWLIATGIALFLRSYTLRHHVSDEAMERATIMVLANLRKTALEQTARTNPGLSVAQQTLLAQKEFSRLLKEESSKVRQTIDSFASKMDTLHPPADNPYYLMEADSYYYYDLTKNILETGALSPQIRGSKYFNPLMMAPEGFWEPLNLHPYIGAEIYKMIKNINPHVSLMEGLSYTPLILTAFIILVYILGCVILECHPIVTLLGSIYCACIPIFVRRSMFGWYKNDPINLFFIFLITVVFLYGLKHLTQRSKIIYTAAGLSFLIALYSLFWQGWVFMATLIFVSSLLLWILTFGLLKDQRLKINLSLYAGLILAGSFVCVSIIFGPEDFFLLFKEGWTALQEFLNPGLPLWPDMYIAVSELLSPKPEQWVSALGGWSFMFIAALGLLSRWRQWRLITPLLLFALITIKLSLSAQRFETLCLVPLSLAFPLGLQTLYEIIQPRLLNWVPLLKASPFSQGLLAALMVLVLAYFPIQNVLNQTPQLLNKIFNSTWDRALTKINRETPPNSIVNTWWPPGHFVKAIAHRRVTFDGATINKPQAYWLANVFMSTDERQAAGILRMLNSSANQATDYLLSQGYSLSSSVKLIKSIIHLSSVDARKWLASQLKESQSDHLVSLTHGTPPPSYLLLYQEMADDHIHFSFVGQWDFQKIESINQNPELKSLVPKRSSKDYVPYLWKMTSPPPRYSGLIPAIKQNDQMVLFENNISVNLRTMECRIDNPQRFGQGIPQSLIFEKDHRFIERRLTSATLPYSVMLIQNGKDYKCILTDTSLAKSILMRLYFYDGKGLKIFEPFLKEHDLTGRTQILVYKINWDQLDH